MKFRRTLLGIEDLNFLNPDISFETGNAALVAAVVERECTVSVLRSIVKFDLNVWKKWRFVASPDALDILVRHCPRLTRPGDLDDGWCLGIPTASNFLQFGCDVLYGHLTKSDEELGILHVDIRMDDSVDGLGMELVQQKD